MIPYGKQKITQDDIKAVIDVLESDFITQGDQVPEFEQALCEHIGAEYTVAVNSATSALHIACLALGLGEGDSLWTSPITFVASANCGRLCGAKIDFVDIDPETYTLCPIALEKKLKIAKKHHTLPKVVVPVHLCGHSCDMKAIRALSIKYGFSIIEDASHAIGAQYKGQFVGSCTYSDVTIFSFHPVKIITTGEGGAALTNNEILAKKMIMLRSHGITREKTMLQNESHGPWYYEQHALGQNYRLTDIQAALGTSQLGRLNEIIEERRSLAERYSHLLNHLPLQLPVEPDDVISSYHLYVIRLLLPEHKSQHRRIFQALIDAGIGVNLHYIPIYKQPYYQRLGFLNSYCPSAEEYYNEAITLPLFPGLSLKEQDFIINKIEEILLNKDLIKG